MNITDTNNQYDHDLKLIGKKDIGDRDEVQHLDNEDVMVNEVLENQRPETLEETAEKMITDMFGDIFLKYPNGGKITNEIFSNALVLFFRLGSEWQQNQMQNGENSWFNQYQEVEDYIIKRIGDKFLDATPEKYNTSSEATIALLEDNWEQDKNVYTEEQVKMLMFDFYYDMSHKMNVPKNLISENATNVDEWFKQFKKK